MGHLSLQHSISSPSSVTLIIDFLIVGQIALGYLCDKIPYIQVMFYSAIFSAIAAFTLLGFASSLPPIFVFVVIFGSLVTSNCIKTDRRLADSRLYGQLQQ